MNNEDNQQSMDIAIVGMAGRFPGAENIDALWELLKSGNEGLTQVTAEDSKTGGLAETTHSRANYVKTAALLAGVDVFDAEFFGYSPKQAAEIDPQQRLFLETAWNAIEDAGLDPGQFAGRIGVFAGAGANRYSLRTMVESYQQEKMLDIYQQTINGDKDFLSTRVSYKLDLRGPSLGIQSACSTSLSAVHIACQNLCLGECDAALAGAVSVLIPQNVGYAYHEGGILSPDGHCRAFDSEAKGTVPASGVGVVVLRRLEDALKSGDNIYAVIRNSALNNDGAQKVGYTAPSVAGQIDVLRSAFDHLSPESIGLLEAHGTGTPLGDAIELAALDEVFRSSAKTKYCALGSLKANIGHLDAAAGVAGLIKAALCLKKRALLPSINVAIPNSLIAAESSPFFVNREFRPWQRGGQGPLRAAVSSFGIGGTNVHAILEEAPDSPQTSGPSAAQIVPISARDQAGLSQIARNLAIHLRSNPRLSLADVAYTLQTGRKPLGVRFAYVVNSREELLAALDAEVSGHTKPDGPVAIRLFFPHETAVDVEVIAALHAGQEGYRSTFDDCAKSIRETLDVDLRDFLMTKGDSHLRPKDASKLQLLSLVSNFSLARWLSASGVHPAEVAGTGLGVLTAAALAGELDIEHVADLWLASCEPSRGVRLMHGSDQQKPSMGNALPKNLSRIEESSVDPGRAKAQQWLDHVARAKSARESTRGVYSPVKDLCVAIDNASATLSDGSGVTRAYKKWNHLRTIGDLWTYGARVDWERMRGESRPKRISLPTYPFNRRRYWIDAGNPFAKRPVSDVKVEASISTTDQESRLHWLAWKPSLTPEPCWPSEISSPGACWLVFADDFGFCGALIKRISAAGGTVVEVRRGATYAEESGNRFTMQSGEQSQVEKLAERLRSNGQSPSRIIHGWSISGEALTAEKEAFWHGADEGLNSLLMIAQVLARAFPTMLCDLAAVTNRLFDQSMAPGDPAKAALPALAAVASQELPRLVITVIDLPMTSEANVAACNRRYGDWILSEVVRPTGNLVAVYRDRRRLIRSFEPIDEKINRRHVRSLRKKGTYVITGGLGKIALAIGQWLAREYQARILLITRHGLPDSSSWDAILRSPARTDGAYEKISALRAIVAAGGEFSLAVADVADERAVAKAISEAQSKFGAINGVFHLAGALGDASAFTKVDQLKRADFVKQAHPKVEGFWTLDHIFSGKGLDFGVLFGSVSAIVGGVGLGAYASANACLDAAALQGGDRDGLHWLSISWDEWKEADSRSFNPGALTYEAGLDLLRQAIEHLPSSGLVASSGNFSKRFDAISADRLASRDAQQVIADSELAASRIQRSNVSTPYVAPSTDIEGLLVEIWESCLGIDGIGVRDDFFELGGDSMIMVGMVARIEETFHVEVPLRGFLKSELTISAFAVAVESRLAVAK